MHDRATVSGEVVRGDDDLLAPLQGFDVTDEQIRVQRIRMIEIILAWNLNKAKLSSGGMVVVVVVVVVVK